MRQPSNSLSLPSVAASPRRREAGAIAGLFLVLITVGASRHEFWRDEANPWLLAGAVSSSAELLTEPWMLGHPPAWYLLAYGLRQVGCASWSLAAVSVVVAALAVGVVALASPFSRLQRWLFPLGFYPRSTRVATRKRPKSQLLLAGSAFRGDSGVLLQRGGAVGVPVYATTAGAADWLGRASSSWKRGGGATPRALR
jgi:hypothetical protein